MEGFVRALFRRRGTVVVECRRCGTSLDRGTAVCPVCESTGVAVYEIE